MNILSSPKLTYLLEPKYFTEVQKVKYMDIIDGSLERCMRHSDESIDGLVELIRHTQCQSVIEIGSFAGESTEVFAAMCGGISSVDCWLDSGENRIEDLFNLRMLRFKNVQKFKMFSWLAAPLFADHKADLVYIDAAHDFESVLSDIELWKPKVKHGGFIAGHDFFMDSVKSAIMELLGPPDQTFVDGSWVIKL